MSKYNITYINSADNQAYIEIEANNKDEAKKLAKKQLGRECYRIVSTKLEEKLFLNDLHKAFALEEEYSSEADRKSVSVKLNESVSADRKRKSVKHSFKSLREGLQFFDRKEFDENCRCFELEMLYESMKNQLTNQDKKKLSDFIRTAKDADEINTYMAGLLNKEDDLKESRLTESTFDDARSFAKHMEMHLPDSASWKTFDSVNGDELYYVTQSDGWTTDDFIKAAGAANEYASTPITKLWVTTRDDSSYDFNTDLKNGKLTEISLKESLKAASPKNLREDLSREEIDTKLKELPRNTYIYVEGKSGVQRFKKIDEANNYRATFSFSNNGVTAKTTNLDYRIKMALDRGMYVGTEPLREGYLKEDASRSKYRVFVEDIEWVETDKEDLPDSCIVEVDSSRATLDNDIQDKLAENYDATANNFNYKITGVVNESLTESGHSEHDRMYNTAKDIIQGNGFDTDIMDFHMVGDIVEIKLEGGNTFELNYYDNDFSDNFYTFLSQHYDRVDTDLDEALAPKDNPNIQNGLVKKPYWYFTKHGVQPGSIPKGVEIEEIKDTKHGTYFSTYYLLTTQELKDFDIKEERPQLDESFKLNESDDIWEEVDWGFLEAVLSPEAFNLLDEVTSSNMSQVYTNNEGQYKYNDDYDEYVFDSLEDLENSLQYDIDQRGELDFNESLNESMLTLYKWDVDWGTFESYGDDSCSVCLTDDDYNTYRVELDKYNGDWEVTSVENVDDNTTYNNIRLWNSNIIKELKLNESLNEGATASTSKLLRMINSCKTSEELDKLYNNVYNAPVDSLTDSTQVSYSTKEKRAIEDAFNKKYDKLEGSLTENYEEDDWIECWWCGDTFPEDELLTLTSGKKICEYCFQELESRGEDIEVVY